LALTFDATLKDLARDAPRAFVAVFDQPSGQPVLLLNVDLSTITMAADTVFGLGDPLERILHLDFQAGADADKHRDVLVYNTILHRQYRVPVDSVVVLLRPQAAHYNLTGTVQYAGQRQGRRMDFGYEVMRLWQQPVAPLLAADLGTLPLAPLCQLPPDLRQEEALAGVVQQVVDRLVREAPAEKVRRLLTAAFLLTGLRVSRVVARELFRGVRAMRESDTYLAILDEGAEKEARKLIFQLGEEHAGPPDEATRTALLAITDLERLEAILSRLVRLRSWQEALKLP
jgi:hypothetical protein